MKRNLIIIIIATIIGGYSCEAIKNAPEINNGFFFQTQFCDSLSLFNLNRTVKDWNGVKMSYYNICKDCAWDSYCLNMSVASVKEKRPGEFMGPLANVRDFDMEYQIRQQMIYVDGGEYALPSAGGIVNYRMESVQDIIITSTTKVFGKEPGSSLNRYFGMRTDDIPSSFRHYIDFVFSRDRILVDRLSRIESIEDYLALYPIINPYLTFYLREKPEEVPLETQFTITVTMEDGRVLCETSDLIKLLQ